MKSLEKVTRVELIDEDGRQYLKYNVKAELSLQDDDRTLKIFVKLDKSKFLPENDGIDHINIYSMGKT